ncbi:MAG: FAD-dependent oxidoreductase [Rhodospirillales bacterium]|nr:FAD-dependent oxidoreductase [Rhodospirillales bacterium]
MADFKKDFLVFGGGIAGLWVFHTLKQKGYDVALIEPDALGGTQTLGSQGMIHGGQKYTLTGHIGDVANNVAKMPALWDECRRGTGPIDLTGVETLADAQIMWPDHKLLAGATAFAAAKAVNGETQHLPPEALPAVLQEHGVKTGYELAESVMDVKSVVRALADPFSDSIYKARLIDLAIKDGAIDHAILEGKEGRTVTISAQKYIFTAGSGNEEAARMLGVPEQITQRRPLRQVMAKGLPHALFGHCITSNPKPRATITSYPANDGTYIWYMGGNIAEKGAGMTNDEAISFADSEMRDLFPKINWDAVTWSSWEVDRAEAYDKSGHLPPGPQFREEKNAVLVWPTKMTFAPALGIKIDRIIARDGLAPSSVNNNALPFDPPPMGLYPWENAEWKKA